MVSDENGRVGWGRLFVQALAQASPETINALAQIYPTHAAVLRSVL